MRIPAGALALVLAAAGTAEAAHPKNSIERLRDTPIVYVGVVEHVSEVARTVHELQVRATFRVLSAPRLGGAAPPATATVAYWSWDDRTPPVAGGPQYRLAPRTVAIVFAHSLAAAAPPAYVMHGTTEALLDQLARHRAALAGWTPEQMAFNEIDEASRRRQLALYDALSLALRSLE
jgi:hypothetical protein